MTPVFKNHAVITKELYTEMVKKTYRKTARNTVGLVFGLAFLFFSAIYILLAEFLLAAIMGIGALALLWMWRYGYRLSAASGYKRQLEGNGGMPPQRFTSFYEDRIEVEADNGGHTVWRYEQITRVAQGKTGIALMLRDNAAILLDSERFEEGERAAFIAFLLKKCPAAKW